MKLGDGSMKCGRIKQDDDINTEAACNLIKKNRRYKKNMMGKSLSVFCCKVDDVKISSILHGTFNKKTGVSSFSCYGLGIYYNKKYTSIYPTTAKKLTCFNEAGREQYRKHKERWKKYYQKRALIPKKEQIDVVMNAYFEHLLEEYGEIDIC